MGDLTVEYHWHCLTAENWYTEVPGSKGSYTVRYDSFSHKNRRDVQHDWSCDCMSYKTRPGYCKHISGVIEKGLRCGWMQFLDGEDVARDSEGSACCPRCRGPVASMGWGV